MQFLDPISDSAKSLTCMIQPTMTCIFIVSSIPEPKTGVCTYGGQLVSQFSILEDIRKKTGLKAILQPLHYLHY